MNLTNQVKSLLKSGSVRDDRGSDAAGIMASRLKKKKGDVISALRQLVNDDQIEVEGSLDHCKQISLKREFVPMTAEGRRQSKYAVDQTGRGYKGTTTGGPVTVYKTLEDWVAAGKDPAKYPLGTTEQAPQDSQPADQPIASRASVNKTKRKKATKPVNAAHQRQRLENIENLKLLIIAQTSQAEDGQMLTKVFKAIAANQLSVSESCIGSYMGDLAKSGYIEFVKDKKYQGEMKFRLKVKMTQQDKLNAGLDVLRKLKSKRSRGRLTDELAQVLKITPKSAQTTILSNLKAIGAYSMKQVGGKFVIDFVQHHPVTDEQMEQLRQLRREQAVDKVDPDDIGTKTVPPAPVASELEVKDPVVVVASTARDEVMQLMHDLVEANEELTLKLNHQTDINSGLISTIQGQDDRIIQLEMELEAERARSSQTISVKLDDDLLSRARRAIGKEPSSTEG